MKPRCRYALYLACALLALSVDRMEGGHAQNACITVNPGKPSAKCQRTGAKCNAGSGNATGKCAFIKADGVCDCLPAQANNTKPQEGKLYREMSKPEVYVLQDGKKIWIPTPEALRIMGHTWAEVNVVPDGSLNAFPRFDISSNSPTPGSLVYPPDGIKWFPTSVVAQATRIFSRNKETHIAELRGWLRNFVPTGCGDKTDFHYGLEVDPDWAWAQGIDLNRLLRAGNVSSADSIPDPGSSPRKQVSQPLMVVELNTAFRSEGDGLAPPTDWTFSKDTGGCQGGARTWPFDPLNTFDSQNPSRPVALADGQYVRMSGSLVTDSPHEEEGWIPKWLSECCAITTDSDAEWRGSVADWEPGVDPESPDHYARWTELHPVDWIQVVTNPPPHRVTTRAVGLVARTGINACEQVSFDLAPDAPRPNGSRVEYREDRGPEVFFPWGQNSDNGSWITAFDDHIHVQAKVCGGFFGGSPGRFKALYFVWWGSPSSSPPSRCPALPSSLSGDGTDIVKVDVLPASVAADRIGLTLTAAPNITWWKQIVLSGSAIWTQDAQHSSLTSVALSSVTANPVLELWKAKGAGVHWRVQSIALPNPQGFGGCTISLTWAKDG
jgi:hypothetical protein